MAGVNSCQPKISNRQNCKEAYEDITGDGVQDLVTKCEKVDVTVKGPEECLSKTEELFPNMSDEYKDGAFSFQSPLTELKKVGTSLAMCRDMRDLPNSNKEKDAKVKDLRKSWGINASYTKDGSSEHCLIEPQKKGSLWRLLSLPVRPRSLKIEDLRNEFMKDLYRHDESGAKIGLGSRGKFELEDDKEMSGIVTNVGFYNPFFDSTSIAKIPQESIKFYVLTEGVGHSDTCAKFNLDEVMGFEELDAKAIMRLSIQFYEGHKSIGDLLDDIDDMNK